MANILKFEIKTTAYYSKAEQKDLFEAFVEWISPIDDDIDDDTAKLAVVNENDVEAPVIDESVKSEIIQEFLQGAKCEATVTVNNGDISFTSVLK